MICKASFDTILPSPHYVAKSVFPTYTIHPTSPLSACAISVHVVMFCEIINKELYLDRQLLCNGSKD